ncbi:flagellar biosynthesis anti-sigma factor FlgM [Desulfomicrobium baculatum]|uniref:Negative regulator of flagellin synthesis n=1 Tax=Desulfomicrobium baculatum (strain DSM 4028 / VKM B-1378 / X) TaxID=525897 RepID=C7LR47_DESBD|nr:flagellar biosynthesis anti-sigma factor FlgM [Desulfomicrobium baculatum]ACU90453.1 Anti-sigma-28 factor FlgM family protein [Desulfomicrobium baculatum DSM 4028]
MTINTIKPFSGYESTRLDHLEQQRQEHQKPVANQDSGTDRISISDEARLKMSMLKAAQENDGVRADKVADVKARIEAGEYEASGKDIAASLLRQELDIWG